MRAGAFIAILVSWSLSVSAAWASLNLLPDGSFEARQWHLTTWDHGKATAEFVPTARHGNLAVQLTGIDAAAGPINVLAYSPAVNLEAGKEYVFSVWYRTSGAAQPSLSMLTYKAPFEPAEWKTPRVQYLSHGLAPSDGWRPVSWRFRAGKGAVQGVFLVRNSGAGTVTYDDASLIPALDSTLTVDDPGTLVGLPDQRRITVTAVLPQGAGATTLTWIDAQSGKELATAAVTGNQTSLSAPVAAAAAGLIAFEEKDSGALLGTVEFDVPPAVTLELLTDRYRKTVFLSQHEKSVNVRLHAHVAPDLRRAMSYAVDRSGRNGPWTPLPAQTDINTPVPATAAPGQLRIAVHLRGVPGMTSLEELLRVVPPHKTGSEVIIDNRNRTLVNGKLFFPRGFYGGTPEVLQPIADAGYNTALTYNTGISQCKAWLDGCAKVGLMGMISLPRPFVTKFNERALRAAVDAVRDHPALLGYYLFDEPHLTKPGETPAELKRVYAVVADEDPYHPVGVCLDVPEYTRAYAGAFDMVMPDPYPLLKTILPLTYVSDRVDESREALQDEKPVWLVPQAFGWDVIKGIDDPERYRTPTPDQERCMTYLGLTHGAQGIIYYCYHVYTAYDKAKKAAGGWPYMLGGYLPDQQPKLWSSLTKLGKEMRTLEPSLTGAESTQGVANGIHYRVIPAAAGRAAMLLAVNPDTEQQTSAVIKVGRTGTPEVMFGNGNVERSGANLTVTLPPYGTLACVLR